MTTTRIMMMINLIHHNTSRITRIMIIIDDDDHRCSFHNFSSNLEILHPQNCQRRHHLNRVTACPPNPLGSVLKGQCQGHGLLEGAGFSPGIPPAQNGMILIDPQCPSIPIGLNMNIWKISIFHFSINFNSFPVPQGRKSTDGVKAERLLRIWAELSEGCEALLGNPCCDGSYWTLRK